MLLIAYLGLDCSLPRCVSQARSNPNILQPVNRQYKNKIILGLKDIIVHMFANVDLHHYVNSGHTSTDLIKNLRRTRACEPYPVCAAHNTIPCHEHALDGKHKAFPLPGADGGHSCQWHCPHCDCLHQNA